jgi:hypothetical protein
MRDGFGKKIGEDFGGVVERLVVAAVIHTPAVWEF